MKIKQNKDNFKEYSLTNDKTKDDLISYAKYCFAESSPVLSRILSGNTIVKNVEKETTNLAYTHFVTNDRRFYCFLNYEMIDNDKDINLHTLGFIMLHELMHNLYQHTKGRPIIKKYRKKSKNLTNILLDMIINDDLINMLDLPEKTKEYINENLITHKEVFTDHLEKEYDIELWYDPKEKQPSANEVFKKFEDVFDKIEERSKQFQKALDNMISGDDIPDDIPDDIKDLAKEIIEKSKKVLDDHDKNEVEDKKSGDNKDKTQKAKINIDSIIESNRRKVMSGRGTSVGDYERSILDFATSKNDVLDFVKFKTIMKKLTDRKHKRSWRRFNRRRRYNKRIPMPSKSLPNKRKHIVFGIDLSGSITKKELERIYGIIDKYNTDEVSIDIIHWSSKEIDEDDEVFDDIDKNDLVAAAKHGHSAGGTIIGKLFNYIEDRSAKKEINLVVFTDGCIENASYNKDIIDNLYFVLTEDNVDSIKYMYPKSKVRCIHINTKNY